MNNYFAPNAKHKKLKFSPSSRVSPTVVPPLHTLRESTTSAPRGATLGTRIDRGISLIMPLRFVRQLRTQTAQSLVLFHQARRSLFSPPLRLAFRLRNYTFRL